MKCDMCGREGQMYKIDIEGSEMTACESCSGFGKVIRKISPPIQVKKQTKPVARSFTPTVPKTEIVESIVPNYFSLIRNKRERMSLTQEDFAKKLNERASLIQHIERGEIEPSISLARKLEKLLGLKLIDEKEVSLTPTGSPGTTSSGLTFGDMVKVKKR